MNAWTPHWFSWSHGGTLTSNREYKKKKKYPHNGGNHEDRDLENCTFWGLVFYGRSNRSAAAFAPLRRTPPLGFIRLFRLDCSLQSARWVVEEAKNLGVGRPILFDSVHSHSLTPVSHCTFLWQSCWQERTNLKSNELGTLMTNSSFIFKRGNCPEQWLCLFGEQMRKITGVCTPLSRSKSVLWMSVGYFLHWTIWPTNFLEKGRHFQKKKKSDDHNKIQFQPLRSTVRECVLPPTEPVGKLNSRWSHLRDEKPSVL